MTSSLVHEPQEGRWLSQLLSDTHSSTKHPWPWVGAGEEGSAGGARETGVGGCRGAAPGREALGAGARAPPQMPSVRAFPCPRGLLLDAGAQEARTAGMEGRQANERRAAALRGS